MASIANLLRGNMDLEQEFQKLMDEAVQKVQSKQNKGEYSHREADDLIDMIAKRRYQASADDGWSASTQSCMDSYSYDRDYDSDGWNRSGVSC